MIRVLFKHYHELNLQRLKSAQNLSNGAFIFKEESQSLKTRIYALSISLLAGLLCPFHSYYRRICLEAFRVAFQRNYLIPLCTTAFPPNPINTSSGSSQQDILPADQKPLVQGSGKRKLLTKEIPTVNPNGRSIELWLEPPIPLHSTSSSPY